jgi:ribose transport system permease protein
MQKLLNDYGMIFVLLALCGLFSALTLRRQIPEGDDAAAELVRMITGEYEPADLILAVGATNTDSAYLASEVARRLQEARYGNVVQVVGQPRDLRLTLDRLAEDQKTVAALATGSDVVKWRLVEGIPDRYTVAENFRVLTPQPRLWPDFLKKTNLLAIVDRIVVIAVIAIGMTMVIVTAGIDLSVGSLVALSAVIGTMVMKRLGGLDAPPAVVLVGFLAGIASCGLIGAIGGFVVAQFKVAPFITTLTIMMMGRGLAFLITGGFSIYQVPEGLTWLGQGRSLGIPNTVILLVVLFATAHIFMSYTRMGRYIYAVGGNEEAARLSGVPVKFVVILVYTVSAMSAGLGGCIQASQLNTGTPNMGMMYELYVIAAVVVGGTSLAGGTGRILGTLIGAFIISVIQNGMNLIGMESYTQQVVLGAVISGAVLLDKARSSGRFSIWASNRFEENK